MKSLTLAVAAASLALAGTAFAQSGPTGSPATAAPMTRAAKVPSDHDSVANRMTAALNILEAKGYGDFRAFQPDGKDYSAAVAQDGQHFTVLVDPDNGQVTRQG
jgi:hypothetical protein